MSICLDNLETNYKLKNIKSFSNTVLMIVFFLHSDHIILFTWISISFELEELIDFYFEQIMSIGVLFEKVYTLDLYLQWIEILTWFVWILSTLNFLNFRFNKF